MAKISYAERENLREHLGTYNTKRSENLKQKKFNAESLCMPEGMNSPLSATWLDDNSAAELEDLADLYEGDDAVVVASGNESCNDGAWWWKSCKMKKAYVLSRNKAEGLRPMSVTYGKCQYVVPTHMKAVFAAAVLAFLAAIAFFRHRGKGHN